MRTLTALRTALLTAIVMTSTALAEGRNFLVPSEWLEEHIDDDNLTILEMRYYPHRYFTIGHIPGAVQVARFLDLGDNDSDTLMEFPARDAFQATLRSWGVNNDSNSALASRVYSLLDLYGFDMSRVKLLDARPKPGYSGEVKTHAVRAGHIPGTINIVSLKGTNPDALWQSAGALAAMYAELPRDKTIIAYCHDGFRMSLAYMQLKSLGFEDVRLLSGGWGLWGNKFSLPVVEGFEPFDEAFQL
ncbi:MAG TPA: sulfurtransferase [Rhodobacterales bacterium]|nr:sulfurtransferase [Rhodobacterales bacterium]